MTSRRRSVRIKIGNGRLAEMIEEATVDCYNESELVTGWFTMIEDNLAVPFETAVLGVQVTVERIDTSGRLRIGFLDRSVDRANHMYGYTVATETSDGSLSFNDYVVSSVNSDPTTGDRWFARNVNTNFPFATAFLGDTATSLPRPVAGSSRTGPTCETRSPSGPVPVTGKTPTSPRRANQQEFERAAGLNARRPSSPRPPSSGRARLSAG